MKPSKWITLEAATELRMRCASLRARYKNGRKNLKARGVVMRPHFFLKKCAHNHTSGKTNLDDGHVQRAPGGNSSPLKKALATIEVNRPRGMA